MIDYSSTKENLIKVLFIKKEEQGAKRKNRSVESYSIICSEDLEKEVTNFLSKEGYIATERAVILKIKK